MEGQDGQKVKLRGMPKRAFLLFFAKMAHSLSGAGDRPHGSVWGVVGEQGAPLGVGESGVQEMAFEGLGREGRGFGGQGRRGVPGVDCGFEPRVHPSLAASHFCISRSACVAGGNAPEALASGNRWIRRAPAMALRAGNAPRCWRDHSVPRTSMHSAP